MYAAATGNGGRLAVDGSYHQCWYPIAWSSELGEGSILTRDVLGGRVIVVRGEGGAPQVLSARCRHLGADLGGGDLVDGRIQCPFHHWRYGLDGSCVEIAAGDRVPGRANLYSYPTEERWDLIWMFNGPDPLYPVPGFPGWDPERMVSRTFEVSFTEPLWCDPWIVGSNAFDFQHLRTLHGMTFEATGLQVHDDGMEYHSEDDTPGAGHFKMHLRLWGTNCIVSMADHEGVVANHLAAGTPFKNEGTRFWFVASTVLDDNADDPNAAASAVLDMLETVNSRILNEDLPVLNALRPLPQLFVTSDRALTQYFRYAERYPRSVLDELDVVGLGSSSAVVEPVAVPVPSR